MASDKTRFADLNAYIDFARRFIDFVTDAENVSAIITSVNENCYKFVQYKEEAGYNITRPLNAHLFVTQGERLNCLTDFLIWAGNCETAGRRARTAEQHSLYVAAVGGMCVGCSSCQRGQHGEKGERRSF